MPTEVIMPKVDMDMSTGTLAQWHVKEGAIVGKGEPLFDIETDKATMEVESPASGTLQFVTAQGGDEIEIGKCIAWIFGEDEHLKEPEGALSSTTTEVVHTTVIPAADAPKDEAQIKEYRSTNTGDIRVTPLARRIAKDRGIPLETIKGSGPSGRITRVDVESARVERNEAQTTSNFELASHLERIGVDFVHEPADRMRQRIAKRLTESKSTVPHFYIEAECNMDNLLQFRSDLNSALANSTDSLNKDLSTLKISINDLVVRACAQSLTTVPEANVSWDNGNIIRYADANISIAVSLDTGGLVTPVIRGAQSKAINRIATEIRSLAVRANNGSLKNTELQGGSFSVSNLGMYDVKAFNAIINPPEAMILAVGGIRKQVVVTTDNQTKISSVMTVVLSCDHRVIDGVLGAQWLREFKRFIEQPALLAMDLS